MIMECYQNPNIFTCTGVPVKQSPWRLGIAHIAAAVFVRGLRPRCASSNTPLDVCRPRNKNVQT